jgi:glycerol-3-phosphate acyltransferase PlsY
MPHPVPGAPRANFRMTNPFYLLPVFGYLLGSVSSAIVIAKLMGLQDPRQVGSGNPGATNVLRYGGKKAAILTLIGDVLKGVVPVIVARALTSDPVIIAGTAVAAFVGHLFPVFHGFKGGKGVATALGVFLALNPWVGLLLAGTWLAMAFAFRYSSLSALVASVLAPAYVAWLQPGWSFLVAAVVMSALLIARHQKNIRNLIAGTETKIGK